jgi:hypothetical protein
MVLLFSGADDTGSGDMKVTVKFEHDILGITKENVDDKLYEYVTDLSRKLVQNECRDVKITTNIRMLTSREVDIRLSIEDMK